MCVVSGGKNKKWYTLKYEASYSYPLLENFLN